MKIIFSPTRSTTRLTARKSGETLVLNGEVFDFSVLPNGATLPKEAIASDWVAGDVTRDASGTLTIPLILPHGAFAPAATRFPTPIDFTGDGPIPLPSYDTETEIDA